MRKQILLFAFICFTTSMMAQYIGVSGTVTDSSGETLIGASVLVQGTTNGTVTDFDGHYELTNVAENAMLEFSYMGYDNQVVPVGGRTMIDVVMTDAGFEMDELVVIGYGSLSKKEVSSSIVQVDSKDFVKGPMNNPMEMLNGKVAGLTVNSTSAADPNASSSSRSAERVR